MKFDSDKVIFYSLELNMDCVQEMEHDEIKQHKIE